LPVLVQQKINISFCLLLWNPLLMPKIVPKAASNSVPAALCSHWSIFFSVRSWPDVGTIFERQAAFGTTFRVTGGYRKAGTSSLKRVTGKIFTISKWFYRSEAETSFWSFITKRQEKIVRTISAYSQSTVLIFRTIFISWHYLCDH
jgi:hypothetical protein